MAQLENRGHQQCANEGAPEYNFIAGQPDVAGDYAVGTEQKHR